MSAWTLQVDSITDGLVVVMEMTAARKCGRVEKLTAYQFPAGWRMNANHVPAHVRSDALRLAREVWE